jgi:hypothetical protein
MRIKPTSHHAKEATTTLPTSTKSTMPPTVVSDCAERAR